MQQMLLLKLILQKLLVKCSPRYRLGVFPFLECLSTLIPRLADMIQSLPLLHQPVLSMLCALSW